MSENVGIRHVLFGFKEFHQGMCSEVQRAEWLDLAFENAQFFEEQTS